VLLQLLGDAQDDARLPTHVLYVIIVALIGKGNVTGTLSLVFSWKALIFLGVDQCQFPDQCKFVLYCLAYHTETIYYFTSKVFVQLRGTLIFHSDPCSLAAVSCFFVGLHPDMFVTHRATSDCVIHNNAINEGFRCLHDA
jgi:hypothetical protein